MNYLPITLLAYFFNAASVLIDKALLTTRIPNPLTYIFYISLVSLLALVLLPFTSIPNPLVITLASISTLLWSTAALLMFHAMKIGQASRVIPVIGTLVPLILLGHSLQTGSLSIEQMLAVLLLVLGLILLTFFSWQGKFSKRELFLEVGSAILFAVSYLFLKQAYLQADFLTVLTYSRLILIPAGLILLVFPVSRKIVLAIDPTRPSFKIFSRVGLLFVTGQLLGGLSEILIPFSIALASPALVNSLQGSLFAFLFLFSLILNKPFPRIFQENLNPLTITLKISGIFCIGIGIYLLSITNTG